MGGSRTLELGPLLDRIHREEFGRLVAPLIRLLGDFAVAEEVVQEAFEAALVQWPRDGVPEVPRAWLLQTARRRAIDRLRRQSRLPTQELDPEALPEEAHSAVIDTEAVALPKPLADDLLRLLFTCCHPALAPTAQVALALRTLCGLTTEEVARAFLVDTPTVAQRLVRAQRKIRDANIPYELPEPASLRERVEAVLATVYLVFNEGYSATSGRELLRIDLCQEAIRLGRLVVALLPREAEATALLSLMLLHHARRGARTAAQGELVLLDHQDRNLWDRRDIDEGLALLDEALRGGAFGAYTLQAAIAALHARAPTAAQTDWPQIAALYDKLFERQPSPVVALNRAAAVAMARGPQSGLALIDDLETSGELHGYHLLPAARAELLRRLGRLDEAAEAYALALSWARNETERAFLAERLEQVRRNKPTP